MRLIFKALVNKKFQIQRPYKKTHLTFNYTSFETSNSFSNEVNIVTAPLTTCSSTKKNLFYKYNLMVLGGKVNNDITFNYNVIIKNSLFLYFKKQYFKKLSIIDAKRFDYTISLFKSTSLSNLMYLSSFSHGFMASFSTVQLARLSVFSSHFSPFNIASPLLNGRYNKTLKSFYRGFGDKEFGFQSLRSLLVYKNIAYKYSYSDIQNVEPVELLNVFGSYMFTNFKNVLVSKPVSFNKLKKSLYAFNFVNNNSLFYSFFNFSLSDRSIKYKNYKISLLWAPKVSLFAFLNDSLNLIKYIFPSLTKVRKVKFSNSLLFYSNKIKLLGNNDGKENVFSGLPSNKIENRFLLLHKFIDRQNFIIDKKNYIAWFNFYLNNNVKKFEDTFHFNLISKKNASDLISKVYGNIFLLPTNNVNFANIALRAYGNSLNVFIASSFRGLFLRKGRLYCKPRVPSLISKKWVLFNQIKLFDSLANLNGYPLYEKSVIKNKKVVYNKRAVISFLIHNFLIKNNLLKNYKVMYRSDRIFNKTVRFSKGIGLRQLSQKIQFNPSIQGWSEELLPKNIKVVYGALNKFPAVEEHFPITKYDLRLADFRKKIKKKLRIIIKFRKFIIKRYNSLREFRGKANLFKIPEGYGFKFNKSTRLLNIIIEKEYKKFCIGKTKSNKKLLLALKKLNKITRLSGIFVLGKVKKRKLILKIKYTYRLLKQIILFFSLQLMQTNIRSLCSSTSFGAYLHSAKYSMFKLLRRFKTEYGLLKNNRVIAHNFEIPYSVRAANEKYNILSYRLTAYNKRRGFNYQMLPKTIKPDFYRDNRVVGQRPQRNYYFNNNKNPKFTTNRYNDNNKNRYHPYEVNKKNNLVNERVVASKKFNSDSLSFLTNIIIGNNEKKIN